MQPRSHCAPAQRGAAALALALLVALTAARAQPTAVRFQADVKDPDKKETAKTPEIKWPTDVNGKDISTVVKEMEDPDPVIREFAARTLPQFGPPATKEKISKLLLKRMTAAEKDPGVRVAVFNTVGQIQFENEGDNKEALRLLAEYVDSPVGPSAALYRLHAIQAIMLFGPKGEGAITSLTRNAMTDPSYETRRNIAKALGAVGSNPTSGPNMKALTALADKLARDESAAVRLESMQSLMMLGPPWAAVMKPGSKDPPPIKTDEAAVIVKYMKGRVGDHKAKPPLPTLEKDKQVEIWARLVLMRFDPREVNEENVDAFARFLSGADVPVKIQALNAITIVGEMASKKLNDVVGVLEAQNTTLQLTIASIHALSAMGAGAKPALPNLTKMLGEKKKELAAKELELAKKKDDPQLTSDKVTLEELVKLLESAIKRITDAKPLSPFGTTTEPPKKP